jgi:hypothetical protein
MSQQDHETIMEALTFAKTIAKIVSGEQITAQVRACSSVMAPRIAKAIEILNAQKL